VHLVGFIIRIYHDARSPGRHIPCDSFLKVSNTEGILMRILGYRQHYPITVTNRYSDVIKTYEVRIIL